MKTGLIRVVGGLLCGAMLLSSGGAMADKKKKGAPDKKAPAPVASEQTVRAVGELAGKFQWGMTPDDVQKIVADEIEARYADKIKKEASPFKQDALRKQMAEEDNKFKSSFIKFDGQATGWDVSIIDREFAHKNDESMMVIWEKDQRRFLFFWQGHLWKQFIAFNAEHPAFQGKTFDDFANIIQRRYGPAAMTFRKLRTSDEQTLDHLEWPPAGDYVLWAIDLTAFYGNFCLSLMQKAKIEDIEKARDVNSPKKSKDSANLVDDVVKGGGNKDTSNDDIVDQITGKPQEPLPESKKPEKSSAQKGGKGQKGSAAKSDKEPKHDSSKSADPLEGSGF